MEQTDEKSDTTNEFGTRSASKSDTEYTQETEPMTSILKTRKNVKDNVNVTFSDDVKNQEIELEERGSENVLKDKMEPQEESATVFTETDSSPLHNPSTGLDLYGTIDKWRKKITPIMKPGTLKEKIKLSKKIDRDSEQDRTKSKEKPTTSKRDDKILDGKFVKIDNTSENILAERKSAKRKIDKSTDLPDKSRYTQTKFHKHDRKYKYTEEDSEMADAKMSNKLFEKLSKERKRKRKDSTKRKDKKK